MRVRILKCKSITVSEIRKGNLVRDKEYSINVEASDTIGAVKSVIATATGTPSDQQLLIYSGKCLDDSFNLQSYNISEGSAIHVLGRLRSISTPASTIIDDSFDDDEYILNPRAYFSKLEALEKETVEGSALFRSGGKFDALGIETLVAEESKDIPNIPNPLRERFEKISSIQAPPGLANPSLANTIQGPELDKLWQQDRSMFVYLCQSYFIICRVLQRFSNLRKSKFCTSFFSLLRLHKETDVAEIVRLRASQIEDIKFGIEAAITHVLDTIGDESLEVVVRQHVENPCTVLLDDAGILKPAASRPRIVPCILTLCHMTAIFLDLALVSYVGSHGLPFCAKYLGQESESIEVQGKSEDDFSFRCSRQPLSCLHEFLDQRTVWVFHFSPGQQLPPRTNSSAKLSILAKMENFADIWGPVWTIPAESGLIKRYNVSKGVICRVGNRQNVFNAVQCHWYSWASFHRRHTSKLLTYSEDLLLADDDLLLIGAVFRQNDLCRYTLGDYEAEYGNEMGTLGTTPPYWKTDSRGFTLGLSKVLGVTISGSQKLIPQTTLKQHILDKWTNNATRANPGLLNQNLGVEISNCTGNARRIPLKSMLLLQAVSPLLERQIPQWTKSLWGSSFLAALGNIREPEAIYDVWRKFPENRIQMAELVCCVLDVLNTTGRRESEFIAGFLHGGQESSVSLDYQRNKWARLLEDSHLSGVYAVINEVCLECQFPNHSAMTCACSGVYTVLQTEVSFDSHPGYDFQRLSLDRKIYERADAGSDRILVFKPGSHVFSILSKYSAVNAWETLNQSASRHCLVIYFRASSRSHHGKEAPRKGLLASAERPAARREAQDELRTDLQPGIASSLNPEEQFDRDRRSERHISPHAHSPTRHQAEATTHRDPVERAWFARRALRRLAIQDSINDTATRYDRLDLYADDAYGPLHTTRPNLDDAILGNREISGSGQPQHKRRELQDDGFGYD